MRKAPHGFTLLEVLVVMSLLSLVMLAMVSALRTTAQTEERIDQKLLASDEMRVANDFLRTVLGRISAQKTQTQVAVGDSPFLFAGMPQEMSWIGIMPARYGVGGRYYFRLRLENRAGESTLVLRYLPWDANVLPDWSQAQTYPLAEHVTALELQYEDTSKEPSSWVRQWTLPTALPQRVNVSLQTRSGPWPDIVVAMRVLPGTDSSTSDQPSFGRSNNE